MSWGFPPWISLESNEGRFETYSTKNQVELLRSHLSRGKWHLDVCGLLLASFVAFSPIALCIWAYEGVKNRCRFHLSTLAIFVVVCGVLLGVNLPIITKQEWAWHSNRWYKVWNCCVIFMPSVAVAVTISFFIARASHQPPVTPKSEPGDENPDSPVKKPAE